jgi:ubiquinol-cytochrome c reductase cytochrome b subunit
VYIGKVRDTMRYAVPSLNWAWSIGAILLGVLVLQIVTGLLITTYFTAYGLISFMSVDAMTRRSSAGYGFYLRLMHQTGVSMLFVGLLCHIIRGEVYSLTNHSNSISWNYGVALYIIFIIAAFTGYACVFGNMSHWAVNVILSTVKTIPYVGGAAVYWFLNGNSYLGDVVPRMFTIHYITPLIGLAIAVLHLSAVHSYQSSGPLCVLAKSYMTVNFYPAYIIRDVLLLTCVGIVLTYMALWPEDALVDRVNYEPANPFLVPRHIVPEWYLLPWYAMLRSIPHKVLGLVFVCCYLLSRFSIEIEVRPMSVVHWDETSDHLTSELLSQILLITCGALAPGITSFMVFGVGLGLICPYVGSERSGDSV